MKLLEFKDSLNKELSSLTSKEDKTNAAQFPNMDVHALRAKFHLASYPAVAVSYNKRLEYLVRKKEIIDTLNSVERQLNNDNVDVYIESAIADSEMSQGAVTTAIINENLEDVVGADENLRLVGKSYNSPQGQQGTLLIQNFLNRPVRIASGTWPLASFFLTEYPVWDLYSLNPAVRAKLRNFAYLRADLHVRLEITGTPFNFGKVLASPQIYPSRNAALSNIVYYTTIHAGSPACTHNYLSQARGAIVMDVRENKPTEFVFPFVCPKPAFRLFNSTSTVLSDVTSYEDLSQAASLFVSSLAYLNNVSGTTTPIRFMMYAWLENVELGTATATQVAITTESYYFESDEREVGPLEKIASAAVSISSTLMQVPILKPFAMASGIVFGAVEHLSALFGWSKPTYIDAPHYMKPLAFQNGAQTIGYDTNFKISMDPKQELSVDPRITGVDEDELIITHMASRDSYITSVNWDDANAVNTTLFQCMVTPLIYSIANGTTGDIIQPASCCFAATPFDYWRGDMEYTIQIAASQFHRGKLMITYEPNINQRSLIPNGSLNKQYTKIIDIQETQTFSFCVKWAGVRSWLKCKSGSWTDKVPYTGGAVAQSTTYNNSEANGYFTISVFNPLINPGTDPINIMIYAKCPNLMVNRLSTTNMPVSRVIATSYYFESGMFALSSVPVSCMDLNESTADDSTICIEHFGERPLSFRSYLRRYTTEYTYTATFGTNSGSVFSVNGPIMPKINLPYGAGAIGADPASDIYGYLRYAFLGLRGSTKKRIRMASSIEFMHHSWARASLLPESLNVTFGATLNPMSTSAMIIQSQAINDGTVTVDLQAGSGLEIELPHYSSNLFAFSCANDLIGLNPGGDQNMNTIWSKGYSYSALFKSSVATDLVNYSVDHAFGEDFTFMRYLGAPNFTQA